MHKEELVAYDPKTGRVGHPPRQVFLEVSSRCNLACVHCCRDFGIAEGHPEVDLPLETVRRLEPWLRSAFDVNLNMVGESLLAPDFEAIVELCAAGTAQVHFNTNGLLVTEARCRHWIESGVTSVAFSIDGIESNLAIRGVPYQAIRRRLVLLDRVKREMGSDLPLLGVCYVLMRRNLGELERVLEDLLPAVRIHCVHVQPLVVFYETLRGENVYGAADVDHVIASCRRVAERHGAYLSLFRSQFLEDERNRDDAAPQIGSRSARLGCTDPFYEIKIRSTGDVMACSYGREPGLNVHRTDLEEIWNGPWYRQLRRSLHAGIFVGRCAGCPFVFGSAQSQLEPLRPGVHHSQAARFLGLSGDPGQPPARAEAGGVGAAPQGDAGSVAVGSPPST